MAPEPSPGFEEGDEYGPVSLGMSWHLLSLLCFAGVLAAKPVGVLITHQLQASRWWQIVMPAVASLVLATLGLLFGLVGVRRTGGRGLARLGVALNGFALLLSLLLSAALFAIMP